MKITATLKGLMMLYGITSATLLCIASISYSSCQEEQTNCANDCYAAYQHGIAGVSEDYEKCTARCSAEYEKCRGE